MGKKPKRIYISKIQKNINIYYSILKQYFSLLQMLTLAKLKASKGNKPYSQPLKIKVSGVSNTARYQVESGEKREWREKRILCHWNCRPQHGHEGNSV